LGHSPLDPAFQERRPWNEGRLLGAKRAGNLRAVQILLGHAKIESSVRYLGVDVEDALELAERTEV
jgi:hypothetical protein